MDASKIRQRIVLLRRAREKIEDLALRRVSMIDGYWIARYIECGKSGCKCASGDKHGPYYYISRTVRGKTHLEYVEEGHLKKEDMCKSWSRHSGWVAQMVKYNHEIESLYRQLAKAQVKRRE